MAKILDGKLVNEKIASGLKKEISRFKSKPKLVIIQVGNLAESNAYIARKKAFGEKTGAIVEHKKFDETVSQKEVISYISSLNSRHGVHGIITQMPFPKHLDKDAIIEAIDPRKDVDGLTSVNLKHLWEDDGQGYTPATTKGVITLLDHYKIPISGKHVVVVGRSFLVGKPTLLAFLNQDATATIAHSKTKDLAKITSQADILVVAVGKPGLITKNHVNNDQVVVDVGITSVSGFNSEIEHPTAGLNPDSKTKLVGDVAFDEVSKIVKAISPVPGGAGPMTVASLFQNLLEAYKRQT
jgi:methylenetetrahydrofolate dehydrogenase (NADP+)/methenyltetrahydrofolate cyclohydrolase